MMDVYAAAMADRSLPDGWSVYCRWAQAVWRGGVKAVLAELTRRQEGVGLPEKDEPDHSPRQIIADTLRYLTNQQSRTRYGQYRRQGLPMTFSHIESTIKQISRLVKGTRMIGLSDWAEGTDPRRPPSDHT